MNHWIDLIYNYLMRVGHSTGCHQDPHRSFAVNSFQFPLCARCSGIMVRYLAGLALAHFTRIPLLVCIGMGNGINNVL